MTMRPFLSVAFASLGLLLAPLGCGEPDDAPDAESAPALEASIVGHWVSQACETRPGGGGSSLYLRRDFYVEREGWRGTFDFFADEACATPTSHVYAEGPYRLGPASRAEPSGREAEFTLATIRVTPRAPAFADFLNGAPPGTCGAAPWQVGVEQSLDATAGCATLGLDQEACDTEYELVKVEGDLLYFGARPADGTGLCRAEARPTSYQVPLERRP